MMQAFWSRAAQTRSSCRCNACLHTASGMARRTTTAASGRGLGAGHLFTACYSTILGTAVFIDTKIKDERRKQWDKAIAEAKAEVMMGHPERKEQGMSDQSQLKYLPSMPQPIANYHEFPTHQVRHDDLESTLNLHLKDALEHSQKPHEVEQTPEIFENLCNEAGDTASKFVARDPVTREQVDKMEGMVSRLVTRLLVRSRDISREATSPVFNPEISQQMKEIAMRMGTLQGADTRLPAYTFYNPEAAKREILQLNDAIEELFSQTASNCSNINVIIAKICYNLLVSSSPPSIQTYDILIRSLSQLRLHDLAQIVVDSFLFDSKFMPTSTTIRLILDHHSGQKDAIGFRSIVNRMRGVQGDMRIKKRAIASLIIPKHQEWALTSKVIMKGLHLREKVSRDANIFDSLINGSLELDKLRCAVRYLRAALREGVRLSSETLCRIVMACTKVLDYQAGLLVLRALLAQWEGESTSTVVYSSQSRFAIRQLFYLCGIEPFPTPTSSLPDRISRSAVVDLQRHLTLTSLEEKLYKFQMRITSTDAMLATAARTSGGIRVKYIRKAISILDTASALDHRQASREEKYAREAAALGSAKVRNENEWLAAQYERLSTKWKRKYDVVLKYVPTLRPADRLEIISFYQKRKGIPQKHRLFRTVMLAKRLDTTSQRTKSTTTEDTAPAADEILAQQRLQNSLPSTIQRLPKTPSSQIPYNSFALPSTPRTLNLQLPLLSIQKSGIEAAAG